MPGLSWSTYPWTKGGRDADTGKLHAYLFITLHNIDTELPQHEYVSFLIHQLQEVLSVCAPPRRPHVLRFTRWICRRGLWHHLAASPGHWLPHLHFPTCHLFFQLHRVGLESKNKQKNKNKVMCTTRLRQRRVRGGFRASWRWLEITGPDHSDPNLLIITLRPLKGRCEWQRHWLCGQVAPSEQNKHTHTYTHWTHEEEEEKDVEEEEGAAFLEWREMFAKPAVSILTLRLIFTEFCLQKKKEKKKRKTVIGSGRGGRCSLEWPWEKVWEQSVHCEEKNREYKN